MTRTFDSLARRALLISLAAAAVLAAAGCEGEPVGRICDLGLTPGVNESVVASPSLDCVTRTCLRVPVTEGAVLPDGMAPRPPAGDLGLCTAECSSDSDCERVPESPCETGFTCGIPVVVGPFCCKKFCICKDYVLLPEQEELAEPMACDPTNADNACCNLDGRAGAYPNCPA
jgi:hypothetical protein